MDGVDTDGFLAAAGELLAMPSTANRPGELTRALDFVLDFVGPGFTVERFESRGKPSALVYPRRERPGGEWSPPPGTGRPVFRVILNAHLDVVPAPPEQFVPRREGDRLYARGAQDMKVSALAEALVFRETARRLPWPAATAPGTSSGRASAPGSPSSARPAGCGSSPSRRACSASPSGPPGGAPT